MQDEPEAGACFSHKMSLKGRTRMLGIDHQHASFQAQDWGELYGWVNQILRQQDYEHLQPRGKGRVRQYLSRVQVARLIRS
jgi:hypothetical protein